MRNKQIKSFLIASKRIKFASLFACMRFEPNMKGAPYVGEESVCSKKNSKMLQRDEEWVKLRFSDTYLAVCSKRV